MSITRPDLVASSRAQAGALARTTTKRGLREFGIATSNLRPVPDFLVIGAKRGGSTSFWKYLAGHPGVLPHFPRVIPTKGLYFFDENYSLGERWYRSHFATATTRKLASLRVGYEVVTGEATPYYLYHPLAPQRARAMVPDALIVAVLRDPVERAFSHYKERRKNGTEELTFAEAVAAEPERLAGEEARIIAEPGYVSFAHRHASYVDQGRYAPMLERWLAAYGRDRVVVIASEDFYADPPALVGSVTDRLGLPRRTLPEQPRFNYQPERDFDPALRDQLTRELAPDVAAVEALLGRSLPWSRPT